MIVNRLSDRVRYPAVKHVSSKFYRCFYYCSLALLLFGLLAVNTKNAFAASAVDTSHPEQLVKTLSADILATMKNGPPVRKGDIAKVTALVDEKLMPYVDIKRSTRLAIGRYWRDASEPQRDRLADLFKRLLIRTYSIYIDQIKDQTVDVESINPPLAPNAVEALVKTKVNDRNRPDPYPVNYKMEKTPKEGWKIYDVNVLGVWMVQAYRGQFTQIMNSANLGGAAPNSPEARKKQIDALIKDMETKVAG